MKRSEMINKLCEPITLDNIDLHLSPEEADAILKRIEQLGMLPPNLTGTVQVEEHDGDLVISLWVWEEEN